MKVVDEVTDKPLPTELIWEVIKFAGPTREALLIQEVADELGCDEDSNFCAEYFDDLEDKQYYLEWKYTEEQFDAWEDSQHPGW